MTLIVNKLPEEIWQMDIPLACKVIAERICALTKNGEQECFISNTYIENLYGMSRRNVQYALNTLQKMEIISSRVTRKSDKKVRLVSFIYKTLESRFDDFQKCKNCTIKSAKNAPPKCKNCTIKSAKNALFSIQSNDHISNDISNDQKTNTSSSQSHTQFSIEKIENDALYLQNIFTEEIMKLAKRNIEARNVSSFIESEKWLKWNRQNDKLKFIKSEKRLRELVSSWVLKSLENVVTHPEVINQEDLTEKRQAFLASLKY